MGNYSTQGSITIKRLRTGDSIFLTLELNGKPLFQSVDEQTGGVTPDWKIDGNRPVITPKVASTRNNVVSLGHHSWKYNGIDLSFTGAASGDYVLDSTGKFGMNPTNGALKIFDNLASLINNASDTLIYSCVATVAGTEYNLTKSIDVQIVSGGASSYYGFIKASTTQLDATVGTATLSTELWLGPSGIDEYYVKWYKGNAEWADKAGKKQISITRDDVNGNQLFIAEFYKSSADTTFIYRAGISVYDTLDEILLVPYISSDNKEVDTGKPVTVQARLVRASSNAVLSPVNPSWLFSVMDGTTWNCLATSTETSIAITTAHTDQADGSYHDVEVMVECTFDSIN